MASLAIEALGLSQGEVAVASTGVIGQILDMSKVEKGVFGASQALKNDPRPFMDAILTTDLVEKWAACIDGETYSPWRPQAPPGTAPHLYGVAKGSGMISPNMATMLAFLISDYDVSDLDLADCLRSSVAKTFNCMTVDSDTSTNDMLLIMANGASGIKPSREQFQAELDKVCLSLAQQVARDGEGATKLVEVRVTGSDDPTRIARAIADSPLVKTAMFGCDPNWGRIYMAAGKAGIPFDAAASKLRLMIEDDEFLLFEDGTPAAFDPKQVSTALKANHVVIDLRLGEGETSTIYTCDLGYGYVRINAEYHT
jgi:glutamate N-acetyltransferase/amino-acid N-acetyltransferase